MTTGFWPLLRPGDHLITAVAYYHDASVVPAKQRTLPAVCGSEKLGKGIVGFEARRVAFRVFGDIGLTRRVLYENMMFGVLCRGLPVSTVERVVELVHHHDDRSVSRLLAKMATTLAWMVSDKLRACIDCIRHDVDQMGFASYRVIHQLAALPRCAQHATPLHIEDEWSSSLYDKRVRLRLPEQSGPRDFLKDDLKMSEGYAAYLQGWQRAAEGRYSALCFDNWRVAVECAIHNAGGVSALHELLASTIATTWQTSLGLIGDSLGIGTERFVADELAFRTAQRNLPRRLVVANAFVSAGLLPAPEQPQFTFGALPDAATKNCPITELQDFLLIRGASPELVIAMSPTLGMAPPTTTKFQQCHLRNTAARLSTSLLERLRETGKYASGSWVDEALHELAPSNAKRSGPTSPSSASDRPTGLKHKARRKDASRFYDSLQELSARTGAPRRLVDCHGWQKWPKQGLYFLLEPGEKRNASGQGMRVVKVGANQETNAPQQGLWRRLCIHRGLASGQGGNHRASTFREIVGAALLARRGHTLETWGVRGSTSSAVRDCEATLEVDVSNHISGMSVLWLPVVDDVAAKLRVYLERNIIAFLGDSTRSDWDPPSNDWLGKFSNRRRVRESGLWNQIHAEAELDHSFWQILGRTFARATVQSLEDLAQP